MGWPPIRSFRKNTMASSQSQKQGGSDNNNSETEGEAKSGAEPCLYVKVSMEGAPYLRKIDLKTYKSYVELSSALEEMFSCFTIGIVVYKSLSLKIIIHVSVTELFHFLQVSLGLTEGVAEMG